MAAQTANRTFREGLTLARTNIPKAAEAKYKEAAGLYTSLPEPDPDGEASTFMELADLYLKSENPKEVKDGMDLLEKAEKLFEEMNDDNGVAAVAIKTGDFFVSDLVLEGASDKDLTTHRYVSSLMYRNAFDSYKKAKNLAGLAAMSDKITYFLRLSDDPDDLRALISNYEELLPYYAERDFAPEKVALYLRIAETHKRLNEPDQVTANFDNALKVYREYGDKEAKEAEAKTYVDIGFVLGEDQEIKKYSEQGLLAASALNDPLVKANTLRYIGNKIQKSWSTGPTAIRGAESEPSKAAYYFSKALELYEAKPEARIQQAETLTDLGVVNLQINKAVALENFQKAYALYTDQEESQRASVLYKIASLQEEKGQLEEALKSYKDANTVFRKESVFDELRTDRAISRVEAKIAESTARP